MRRPSLLRTGVGEAGIKLDGAVIIGACSSQIAFVLPDGRAVETIRPCPGKVWVELDGLVLITDRLVEVSFEKARDATFVVAGRETQTEFDRLLKVGERAIKVALILPRDAAIVPGLSETRIKRNRLSVVIDDCVPIPLAVEHRAAVHLGLGIARVDLKRTAEVGERAVEVPF